MSKTCQTTSLIKTESWKITRTDRNSESAIERWKSLQWCSQSPPEWHGAPIKFIFCHMDELYSHMKNLTQPRQLQFKKKREKAESITRAQEITSLTGLNKFLPHSSQGPEELCHRVISFTFNYIFSTSPSSGST